MGEVVDDTVGDIVGVVLGAGASTRLGRPKQLLPFGGRPLLAHVVADVEASSTLDRVVVVLGGPIADDVAAAIDLVRAVAVRTDGYGSGCASSLLAGLDAAGDCEAIVMLLGDMPGVTPAVIDRVVGVWRAHPTWAAVTSYRGELGHPFVFSAAAFPALRSLHGDKAVWKFVDAEPESRVARIDVRAPLPRDIDTWDDYVTVHAGFGFDAAERARRVAPGSAVHDA